MNEAGCYTAEAPEGLKGLDILGDGNFAVIERLKEDIIKVAEYTHSYPYDWRTKKPTIFRLSEQWFINTAPLIDASQVWIS